MKMMLNKVIVLLICVAFGLTVLSACGAQQTTQTGQEGQTAAEVQKTEAAATNDVFDYSSVSVLKTDPDFSEGAYFYKDLKEIWGKIPVPDREIKIGYIVKSLDNSFWQAIKKGVDEEAKNLQDAGMKVTVDVRAAQGESDQQGQLSIMMDMINKKYDAIVFNAISDANLVPGIEAAQEAGIIVVTGNQRFDGEPKVPCFFGDSEYTAGTIAADYIAKKLGDNGGDITIVSGIANNSAARSRTQSFEEEIKKLNNPNIKVVDIQNADWDRSKAKDVVDIQLKKFPNLKAVFCNNDTMAMGALEAVRDAGKLGDVIVAGVDATDEGIASIKKGELAVTVASSPFLYGRIGLEIALRALAGQNLPEKILGPYNIVDKDNVNMSDKELWGWKELEYEKVN